MFKYCSINDIGVLYKVNDDKIMINDVIIEEGTYKGETKDYISAITYAKVNDTEYKGGKGRKFGKVAFNEDGSINLDAKYSNDGKDEPVFKDAGTYKIQLSADGYPDLTFEVTK